MASRYDMTLKEENSNYKGSEKAEPFLPEIVSATDSGRFRAGGATARRRGRQLDIVHRAARPSEYAGGFRGHRTGTHRP